MLILEIQENPKSSARQKITLCKKLSKKRGTVKRLLLKNSLILKIGYVFRLMLLI